MGANQSRPTRRPVDASNVTTDAAIDAQLLERLQALRLKEEPVILEKGSYVMVGEDRT